MSRAGRGPWVALLLGALCLAGASVAESAERPARRSDPHAGYVYPAGGQVGTTVHVKVGGQYLRGVDGIHMSGDGVEAVVRMFLPPPRPLDGGQRRLLQRRLAELRQRRLGDASGEGGGARRVAPRTGAQDAKPVELPKHPLLEDLESKTLDELKEVAEYFFRPRNPLQRKRAIEEVVKLELTIAPDATPGMRELRLRTRNGLSNPLRFRVGLLPEVREREPNHPDVPADATVDLPVVFNGQILPRDVDRFRFRARAGQHLVLRAEARALIPYQADSVPGWMQATLALFDPQGRELAFADEYRFDPDPVLFYEVPADGEYLLEVRDAVARGRDDFVYRVAVGELPFVTRIFPLGGRAGEVTSAAIQGWNLRWDDVVLDTREAAGGVRAKAWRQGERLTNEVVYGVGTLPEVTEREPNEEPGSTPLLDLPVVVNGRIARAGDRDVFRFEGRAGSEIVAEVRARSLGSPLDSVLRLTDAKGAVVAWNDDHPHEALGVRGLGLQTHAADATLRARLPRAGIYAVEVTDVRRHGGEDFAYRLRLSEPRPDVTLFVTPSTLNLQAGRTTEITVHAVRRDGFDGEIDLALVDAPEGFALGGARIPAGRNRVRMTLTAPRTSTREPVVLRAEGRFRVGRESQTRTVVPADDMMQAFLWRHLVPAQELCVTVLGNGRWVPRITLATQEPIRIPRHGKVKVAFDVQGRVQLKEVSFELVEGPPGVSLGAVKRTERGLEIELEADGEAKPDKRAENLIIEVIAERAPPAPKGGAPKGQRRAPQRFSVGVLPAVPYRIIQR